MSLLAQIVATKKREIAALRTEAAPANARKPRDVRMALARAPSAPLRLIAEVKLRSPSAGPLSRALDPATRACSYARAGATMVSVLCDATYFDGSWTDLAAARARFDEEAIAAPLLAKEFVIDPVQIDRARACGADAVLVIARIAEGSLLAELIAAARARDLEPLVEVTDAAELERALAADAHVLGVNARDLDTLAMCPERAARVLAAIPRDRIALHFSGIRDANAVRQVATSRADGALVGEALMREADPAPLLKAFVAAAG